MSELTGIVGNLCTHAEALQKTAQEQQTLVAELLVGAHERIQQLEELNTKLSERVATFSELPKKLGVLAYKGGEVSVAQALRSELDGLSSTIEKTTNEALTPALAPLKDQIANAVKASDNLAQQTKQFSMRTLGVVVAGVSCALIIFMLGVWGALAWQRSEIESKKSENAVLSIENEEMKANAERLKELGGKIVIFESCKDAQGKVRKCIAIPSATKLWDAEGKTYYSLK